MKFEFATATRIVFGRGKRVEVFRAAPEFGRKALLVTGSNPGRAEWLREGLKRNGVETVPFKVPHEPTVCLAEEGSRLAREKQCEFVVSIGGGSVIDAGKAIAALATNPGAAAEYLEVIGAGKPLIAPPLRFIAMPTTAGTGAEVTRNAVLAAPEHKVKVSLRSPKLLAELAVIDSELTDEVPSSITAATGMDALTQLIEPFLSVRANPLTDALCREGIAKAARALPIAFRDGGDATARDDMALASFFSGLALANAGLGAVHGFAAAVGGMFAAPHGEICAALLPAVMDTNYHAVKEGRTRERFREVAVLLTGSREASVEEGLEWVKQLTVELGIRPLRTFGVREEEVDEICSRAAQASSMKANPIVLGSDALAVILRQAI